MSSRQVYTYTKKKSAIGTGKQESHITIGSGVHELLAACIYTDTLYPVTGEIAFVRLSGDGSTEPQGLIHGWISHQIGLDISNSRIIEGPGYILGITQNLETTGYHWLETMYRKLEVHV